MLIDFPNFEGYLREHDRESILNKGKTFKGEKLIKHIHAFSGNEWDVYVESERPNVPGYTVRVRIQGNKVTYMTCNCQGFRFGPICKHIVGSLYAIRENKLYDSDIGEYSPVESEDEMELEQAKEEKATPKKAEEGKRGMSEEKEEKRGKSEEKKGKMEEEEEQGKSKKVTQGKKGGRPKKNLIERELECQVCRGLLQDAVILPCQSHSACLSCAKELFQHGKKDSEGARDLMCPSCGKKGGSMKIKDVKDLKPNKELERVKHAYDKEKEEWMKEKDRLHKELEDLKKQSQGGTTDEQKDKGNDDKITEEISLSQQVGKVADADKLKEVAEQAFFKLKNEGEDVDSLMKELKEDKGEEEKNEPTIEKGGKSGQKKKGGAQSSSKKAGGKKGALATKEDNVNEKKSPEIEEHGKASGTKGAKGSTAKESAGKKGDTSKKSAKRKGGSLSPEKENAPGRASEGGERYGLRDKKVKSYVE